MLVVCPGCAARYRIGGDRVPLQGARARCPKCERVFRVGLPPVERGAGSPPAPSVNTEEPRGGSTATAAWPGVPAARGGAASLGPASPGGWDHHLVSRHLAGTPGDEEGQAPGAPAGGGEEGAAEVAAAEEAATPTTERERTGEEEPSSEGSAREAAASQGASAEGTAEAGPALKGPAHDGPFLRPGLRRESTTIGDERLRARLAERVRQTRREGGNLPLLVTHGYGVDDDPERLESISAPGSGPPPELLALSDADMATIAEDIVSALVATHADEVARARADERWDAHLGPLIRESWSDFQACVGSGPATDRHFRNALNRILTQGRDVF